MSFAKILLVVITSVILYFFCAILPIDKDTITRAFLMMIFVEVYFLFERLNEFEERIKK